MTTDEKVDMLIRLMADCLGRLDSIESRLESVDDEEVLEDEAHFPHMTLKQLLDESSDRLPGLDPALVFADVKSDDD